MKTIIILSLLLSGCALTPASVGSASDSLLCRTVNVPYGTTAEKNIAASEIMRRNTDCNYVQALDDANRLQRSAALLNFGAQMLNNSQPQPIYAPSQTVCRQQGIYTYCNQY